MPPTSQSIEVKDELTAEIEKQLAIFDEVLQSDIKKFNEQFNALNLEYLVIEKEKK
ncbi:glycosyl hydrolase [Nonlabens ulvanivorans]|nr:glycosyl hydrolase [Nonlabens ulvanivorans]